MHMMIVILVQHQRTVATGPGLLVGTVLSDTTTVVAISWTVPLVIVKPVAVRAIVEVVVWRRWKRKSWIDPLAAAMLVIERGRNSLFLSLLLFPLSVSFSIYSFPFLFYVTNDQRQS